jgi:CHASE3 domain sensor protein
MPPEETHEARLRRAETASDRAAQLARVALIVAAIAIALAVLGLFLPIDL